MICLRSAFWLAFLAASVRSGRLSASDGAFDEPVRESTVDIVLAGGDDLASTALITTLRRSLERIGATVTFSRLATMSPREVATAAKRPSVAVTVWIDIGTPKVATIYITEGKNVFARRFDLDRVFDSVALDLLDVVVTSSIETVLSGHPLGVTREEFTRSLEERSPVKVEAPATPLVPPAVPPAPPAPSGVLASVGILYEGAMVARTLPTSGPGLRIDGRADSLWLALGLYGRLPFEVSSGGATARFLPVGLRLFVGRVFSPRPRLALIVACGAGVDVTHVRPESTRSDLTAAASFFATDVVVRPSVEIERRFSRLTLGLTAGLDTSLLNSVYAVGAAPGARPFWTPWRFRPSVGLIVGWVL